MWNHLVDNVEASNHFELSGRSYADVCNDGDDDDDEENHLNQAFEMVK